MNARLLFISTPVSAIGVGNGGGVETTLQQITPVLAARGHKVTVLAPSGSKLPSGVELCGINGASPPSATTSTHDSAVIITNHGVLQAMWEQAVQMQHDFDVLVAMSYDWLSYYLTPFFSIPVLHWITVSSSIDAVDTAIAPHYLRAPQKFAFYSHTQASTFPFVEPDQACVLPGAVDLDQFHFNSKPARALVWAGRISPEKGLEHAVEAACRAGIQLHICGKIQDQAYWDRLQDHASSGQLIYHGLLAHGQLQEILGNAMAMLVTPNWIEAFGLTVIEALACGTPVIAWDQGGPGEIIEHGTSGFLVPQGDLDALTAAIFQIPYLDRRDARRRAEQYSVGHLSGKVEQWITSCIE